MYQVLARKWRPQGFEELVGQPHVARTLTNAIAGDRLAHAYIFAGLRGTGKTSAARIFAKCLNCEQGPTATPCNTCTPCTEITESRAMDVLEMDAASRTGVDDIRELQEVIAYPPVRDRYKLLILDEAHMLSKNAVNALLKTLEEPPPRVIFVLATTEIQKIIPTVLSRCQVFEFRRVSPRETTAHLVKLCAEEQIEISEAALERIARAGEGSVRDSLSLLERAIAFCGNSIGDEDVLRVLGAVRGEVLVELVRGMAARDAAAMLGVLDGLVDEGHDLVHFWSELIAALRDLLLLRAVPDRPDLLARSEDVAGSLAEAAADLSREDLSRIFQIVADLEPALKASGQPRYLFEATLVRVASLGSVRPIEEVLARLGGTGAPPAGRSGSGSPGPGGGSPTRRSAAPRAGAPRDRSAAPAAAPPAPAPPAASGDVRGRVLDLARRRRPMLAAILDEAAVIRLAGDRLQVRFPAGGEALRRQLDRRDNAEALAGCAAEALGRKVRVESATDSAEAPAVAAAPDPGPEPPAAPGGDASPAPAPADAPARDAGPAPSRPTNRRKLIEQATSEPGVRRLLREFGAQVVDIRPLGSVPPETEDTAPEDRA